VPAKNPIRIHHLFEMTSGMNYDLETPAILSYRKESGGRCPTVETVKCLAKTPLEFEPGESWLYSLSHDVLAALVEVLSGERFEVYVKKHIFDPLGMTHSDFLHDMNDWEGFACKFHRTKDTGIIEPYYENSYRPGPNYASGGAGCVSMVEDYIKFLEALRVGDVILKKETIAMMATDALTDQQREMYTYGTEAIGYGLGLRAPRGKANHTEFGWAGACGAYCSVDPVNNITFYYSQHVNNNPNRHLRRYLYTAIRGDILGEKVFVPINSEDEDPTLTY
jgi:CubicO group peptidase (beta-lactamase class C family)